MKTKQAATGKTFTEDHIRGAALAVLKDAHALKAESKSDFEAEHYRGMEHGAKWLLHKLGLAVTVEQVTEDQVRDAALAVLKEVKNGLPAFEAVIHLVEKLDVIITVGQVANL